MSSLLLVAFASLFLALRVEQVAYPFAEPDPLLDRMVATAPPLERLVTQRIPAPFDWLIPRTVHQIWFGNPRWLEEDKVELWQQYARVFHYNYHLWTEADDPYLAGLMGQERFDLMRKMREEGRFDAASDIVRYVLIAELGGLYFDVDVPPPTDDAGALIEMTELTPLCGLIVTGEQQVREVLNGAFYAQNNIIMGAAGHPVMRHLVEALVPNYKKWFAGENSWDLGAQHITGQILFNRALFGAFTFFPYREMRRFHMECYYDQNERRRTLEAKYVERYRTDGGVRQSVHWGAL